MSVPRSDPTSSAINAGRARPADLWRVLDSHRDSVLRAVRPYCTDPADAEDCVHDAFVQVAECNGIELERVGGLLRTIAIRRAIDVHRSRASHRRALRRLGPEAATAADLVVIDRQEATDLAAVAQTLPPSQRRALAARVEGYKPREAAALLGVPAKSIHLALSRARTTLKAAIAATPVVLGGWLGLRALRRVLRVAPATAMAVTGVLVLMVHLDPHSAPTAHAPSNSPARVAQVSVSNPAPSPHHGPQVDHAARFAAPARPDTAHAAPPATPMVRAGSVAVGVGVDQRHTDQSLLQSVQACVSGGISLELSHAGCNAAYAP